VEWNRPKTFAEYVEHHPDHVYVWLSKYHRILYASQDMEDIVQFIMLRTLESQRVEKYDPYKRGPNDTAGLFFNWMSKCFERDIATYFNSKKAKKRKVNENTVSLESLDSNTNNGSTADHNDILSLFSTAYRRDTAREGNRIEVTARINQFYAFMKKHRPDLLPVLDRMAKGIQTPKEEAVKYLAMLMDQGRTPSRHNPRKQTILRRERKYNLTKELLEATVLLHKRQPAAAKHLGCSMSLLTMRVRELTGFTWGELVKAVLNRHEHPRT
jgi:hypothetical protein